MISIKCPNEECLSLNVWELEEQEEINGETTKFLQCEDCDEIFTLLQSKFEEHR